MRVFAGPNGSGKSTIIKEIEKSYRTGAYINADEIEKSSREKGFVNLGDYSLQADAEHFLCYLQQSTLRQKAQADGFTVDLKLSNNIITIGQDANSYEAALIAEYLRRLLIAKGETFSFETVMSHPSKIDVLRSAHDAGFMNYLYFISTESADINVNRVNERVAKGGHPVDEQKIRERYNRSMELIPDMIPYCHRCYFIDNSGEEYRLIVELEEAKTLTIHSDEIPGWVDTYVLQKLGI